LSSSLFEQREHKLSRHFIVWRPPMKLALQGSSKRFLQVTLKRGSY
jgi:hypothetical protein